MRALSVRQPWAWLIVHGPKRVENRDWATHYRGPLLIHAAKTMTQDDYDACQIFVAGFSDMRLPDPAQIDFGGIVGTCVLIGCVEHLDSPWFCGQYGFVLSSVEPVPFLPCRGFPGMWDQPYEPTATRG